MKEERHVIYERVLEKVFLRKKAAEHLKTGLYISKKGTKD